MEKPTIYLCPKEGVVVRNPVVCVGDVVTVFCKNKAIGEKAKKIVLFDFSKETHPITAITALFILREILKKIPDADLQILGPSELVVEYVPRTPHPVLTFLKMTFVCMVLFFGGAFSMMSFHTDVGLRSTFDRLYVQLTGQAKPPVTILEISYSVGVCLGILVFFNHVGKKKLTHDPTPIQVQMRQYEQNVEQVFMATSERKGRTKDV
ncbi:MAG: hypothetical protein E7277_06340 [Lachnospiraceae bacterium]|nr:hypothetical protein [Lachnospiraceae bacterium]